MIRAELDLIKQWMIGVEPPILDLGSSTLAFRQRSKLQYDLAELIGQSVVSFDAKDGPGVDVVGDAENLHWHVDRPNALRLGGRCIITAPWVYPDHPDPEDNYRFSVSGLRSLAAFVGLGELASGMLHDGPHAISFWVGFRRG